MGAEKFPGLFRGPNIPHKKIITKPARTAPPLTSSPKKAAHQTLTYLWLFMKTQEEVGAATGGGEMAGMGGRVASEDQESVVSDEGLQSDAESE